MDEEKRHGAPPGEAKAHGASGGKSGGKSDFWLTVIGVGKLIKVAILLSVGIAALVAVNHRPPELLAQVANFVGVDHNSHHLHRLIAKVSGVTPKKLEAVSLGCFVYAALFATEGIGLLTKKRWAEYLTIVITLSFVPLELYEIFHHTSIAKVVTLLLNVAVALYLMVRVRRERNDSNVSAPERDPRSAPAPLGIASR
jgi:uncharacterized membrane protein (DUF2068 family)